MDTTVERWSWLGSVGAHGLLLLLLLYWGALNPPQPLPKPEPIRLTIIDFPGKTGPAAAPGPAKRPQLAKAAARPAPVPAKPQPAPPVPAKAAVKQRTTAPPRTASQASKQDAPAKVSHARPEGDFKAAMAARQAELQARNQARLAEMGASGAGELMTGTGGGDAGQAGGELAGRQLLREVKPTYPRGALVDRVSGRVMLSIVVAPNGTVASVTVSRSSGDARLDQAARQAIAQWRFAPLPDGLPAANAQGSVPVTFWYRKG